MTFMEWLRLAGPLCSGFTFGLLWATRRTQKGSIDNLWCRYVGHRWRRHLFERHAFLCQRCPAELLAHGRRHIDVQLPRGTIVGVAGESVERGQVLTMDLRSEVPAGGYPVRPVTALQGLNAIGIPDAERGGCFYCRGRGDIPQAEYLAHDDETCPRLERVHR